VIKLYNAIILSDIHAPYQHPDLIPYIKELKSRKYTQFLQTGDFGDGHAFSRHPKLPELYQAADELHHLKVFVKALSKEIPHMHMIYGNHDTRIFARMSEIGIPGGVAQNIHHIYGMPHSWKIAKMWKFTSNSGQILLTHGHEPTIQNPINYANEQGCNVIMGHLHSRLSLEWQPRWDNTPLWGMITSCMVDLNSMAFKYGAGSKKPMIIGHGALREGEPLVCRMPLDRHNRWTGKLPTNLLTA
jgi:predicted phosphodiesterase